MTPTLTRADLDRLTCGTPDCDCDGQLTLHGRCHMAAPTWATYDRSRGVLAIRCSECGALIAVIQVAPNLGPQADDGAAPEVGL